MKRKSFEHESCPVARSLEAAGDAWSMLVVRDAFAGKRRFGEFVESLGIAKNILTVRLRKLVGLGVLEQVAVEGSPYHEYNLTEKGRGLFLVLVALGQWGCGEASGFRLVDTKKGERVRLELRTEGGKKVGLDDVRLVTAGGQ